MIIKKLFVFTGTYLLLWLSTSSLTQATTSTPLIGTNYSHYSIENCNIQTDAILVNYHKASVRATVQEQLKVMKKNGVETLRIILWYNSKQVGINLPAENGKLPEPYRTNLINYVTDVKNTGYTRLTVTFGNYKENTLANRWNFIADVRPLIKKYGPIDTRITLVNVQEDYKDTDETIEYLYKNYVKAFGNTDVSAAAIGTPDGVGKRLQTLINVYKHSGVGQPKWFALHSYETPEKTLANLIEIDQILTKNNLPQPIVLQETFYNNPATAKIIQEFAASHPRKIEEVIQWPLKSGSACQHISQTPPYSISALWPLSASPATAELMSRDSSDFNRNGRVDILDYNTLVGNFGQSGTQVIGDSNKSGKVDIFDYTLLVQNFGKEQLLIN